MGFFDNIIKNSAKKFVTETIDKKIDSKVNNIANSILPSFNSSSSGSSSHSRKESDSIHKKLDIIFSEEFAEYDIRCDVSAQEFFAEDGAQTYTYGMYLNGQPKAMIMILDGHNEYRKASILKAQNACIRNGIPYMNFMSYMSNHYDYVSKRLHDSVN